jgi:serine/threonine-protein kinase
VSISGFTPGARVGRYDIVKKIGAGGMAEVFLARRRDGEGTVAIKRLLPTFAHEPRFVDMFIEEARLAATLHHPNIVEVFDVGIEADSCYYAMELVDGHDVRALVAAATTRGRPMPLPLALSITYGVTCALAYVQDPRGPHGRLNIVHRDVSPSNVLVSFAGAIKLVDFGIARIEKGAVTRTPSGQLKGKVPYMSPEQCRARALDGRSDLFSLGVVLYELTTNVRPFDRESEFDTLEAIVRGQFIPPSQLVPGYPADLEAVVERLLATRPNDRYPAGGALLVDLDRIVAKRSLDLSERELATQVAALLGAGGDAQAARPPRAESPSLDDPRTRTRFERMVTFRDADAGAGKPPAVPCPAAQATFERVAAREAAILGGVAPGVTDARELAVDAVAQLIGRAIAARARDDLETAVLALELALSAARPDAGTDVGIDALLASNEPLFLAVFTAYIGDQTRMLAVSQHLDQLIGMAIDQRAAYLMTRIDGSLSARELLATCGLAKRDACRHLCQLMLRELVILV